MVFPYLYQILRAYAPAITLPVAIVVGAIGYTLENKFRNDKTPSFDSIEEKRRKRQEELGKVLISPDPIPDPSKIVPKTILDKNLPPSLQPMAGNQS